MLAASRQENAASHPVAGTNGQETYGLELGPGAVAQQHHGTDRGQPKGWPPCLLIAVQATWLTPLIMVDLTFDEPNRPAVIELIEDIADHSVRAMPMPARAMAAQLLLCVLCRSRAQALRAQVWSSGREQIPPRVQSPPRS